MTQPRHLWLLAMLAACGGGTPAPSSETPHEDAADAKPAESAKPDDGKSLARHREDFMSQCTAKIAAPDYCDCSWQQMTAIFSEADMNATKADPAKMNAFRDRVTATCAGKLPEPVVKQQFTKECVGQRDKLAPYCDCAWTELRKQLSTGDLAQQGIESTPRVSSAKKAMMKKCGQKMPEEIPRDDFMASCAKDDPDKKPFCQCAWKTVRSEMSPAEIAGADGSDMEPLKEKLQKSCGKLLHAK
jgi:hypothetical protein